MYTHRSYIRPTQRPCTPRAASRPMEPRPRDYRDHATHAGLFVCAHNSTTTHKCIRIRCACEGLSIYNSCCQQRPCCVHIKTGTHTHPLTHTCARAHTRIHTHSEQTGRLARPALGFSTQTCVCVRAWCTNTYVCMVHQAKQRDYEICLRGHNQCVCVCVCVCVCTMH